MDHGMKCLEYKQYIEQQLETFVLWKNCFTLVWQSREKRGNIFEQNFQTHL